MSYMTRDWIEVRREYLRLLAELEARLDARAAANAVNSDRQVQQLAEQGNVSDAGRRAEAQCFQHDADAASGRASE